VQGTIPNPKVRVQIADLAVGLASDSNNPEKVIDDMLRDHLKDARMLPFVAFLDHDGKWVDGFAGSLGTDTLLQSMEKAEKAPALQASPAVRKKFAGLALRADGAVGRKDWKTVVKSAQKGAKLWGRCPERTALQASVEKARAWAEAEFVVAGRLAAAGSDIDGAEKKLKEIKGDFRGEPEEEVAATGLEAIKKLREIVAAEKDGRNEELRENAAAEFEKSRWKSIFTGPGGSEEESEIEGLD
jgi:hypothetical protein